MLPGYSVRVARPDDQDAITRLLEASYYTLMRDSYPADDMDKILPLITQANPGLLSSGNYYLAVNKSGGAIGSGGWSLERPGSGERIPKLAHIRHFGIHPDWTRRGVGRALFDRCAETARLHGVNRFECYSSLNGERFYAALGFERKGPIDIPIRPSLKLPSVLMQCSI